MIIIVKFKKDVDAIDAIEILRALRLFKGVETAEIKQTCIKCGSYLENKDFRENTCGECGEEIVRSSDEENKKDMNPLFF